MYYKSTRNKWYQYAHKNPNLQFSLLYASRLQDQRFVQGLVYEHISEALHQGEQYFSYQITMTVITVTKQLIWPKNQVTYKCIKQPEKYLKICFILCIRIFCTRSNLQCNVMHVNGTNDLLLLSPPNNTFMTIL